MIKRIMNRLILIVSILAIFQVYTVAAEVETYRNNQLGFEVSYFSSWEQAQSSGNPAFFIKRISAVEPGTISINVANFTGNKDDFMRSIKANPEMLVKKYKQRFPSAEMHENGETYLGGFPAYIVVTRYKLKNLNFELDIVATQVFCIKGRKIYLVSFETSLPLYAKISREFQAILATFNFR